MAEVLEPEGGGEPETSLGPVSPSAAMAIGVRKGRAGAKADAVFDSFLRDQQQLINLQTEHLHEQRELITSRLRLGRWKDRVTLTLQALTVIVGVIVAGAVGVLAWQAHEDHGVTVAAFSVPPDLAQRGLTGEVVASRLIDRLSDFQASTVTGRPASTYADDWGSDIRVEIPETGVSVGELNRWLRQWLGSETRITGDVVRTPAGVAVTARVTGASGRTFEGPEANLDALIGQAAEAIYAQTQPYRYAVWIEDRGQGERAAALFRELSTSGDAQSRAWSQMRLAVAAIHQTGDLEAARQELDVALKTVPGFIQATANQSHLELALGHYEAALRLSTGHLPEAFPPTTPDLKAITVYNQALVRPVLLGDPVAVRRAPPPSWYAGRPGVIIYFLVAYGSALAHDHPVLAPAMDAGRPNVLALQTTEGELARGVAAFQDGDASSLALLQRAHDQRPGTLTSRTATPWLALAKARFGDLAGAQALIGATAADCYPCLVARGRIAGQAGDARAAERWLAEAIRQGPDLPQAFEARGELRLGRGDAAGALADATAAQKLSPNYPDALKLEGDVLAARGDFAGAVAAYGRALALAPTWTALRQALASAQARQRPGAAAPDQEIGHG